MEMAVLFTPGSLVLSRALSCGEGAGMCLRACVHVQVRACVCEREAPGYLGPSAHVRVFCGQTRPGSLRISQTHTYTINTLLPLWKSELSAA